jgi:hypothetical protein
MRSGRRPRRRIERRTGRSRAARERFGWSRDRRNDLGAPMATSGRRCRRTVLALAALSSALGDPGCTSAPTVGGNTFTGRIQEGVQVLDTGGNKSAGFLHNYDVSVVNRVLAGISYRLGMRALLTDTSLENSENSNMLASKTYEPTVDVSYHDPVFDAETGGNGLYNKQGSGSDATSFTRDDVFGRLGWNPIDLPSMRLGVERIGLRGDGPDSVETETDFTATHGFGPWRATYAGTWDDLNADDDTGRSINENIGRLDYQQDLDDKGTNLAMGGLIDDTQRHDSSVGQTTTLPTLSPIAGLSSIDDTPLTGALTEVAALIDGNLNSSAGVNIGSSLAGGGTDRNIGVDLGTPLEVQGMHVYTDSILTTTDVSFYQWAVYRSEDNQTWFAVTGAASFTYSTSRRRFELSFDPTVARYVKVVNVEVPPTAAAVFVTEIVPLGTGRGTGSPDSSRRLQTVHVTIRFYPMSNLDVTASALAGTTTQDDFGVETRDETRTSFALAGHYTPHHDWDFDLSGSTDRENDKATTDRIRNTGSGLVSYRPWPGLETALSGSHRTETEDGHLDTRTYSGGVRVGVEVSPELSTSLDVTRTITTDASDDTKTRQWTIAELLFAKLTREWQLEFDTRVDRSDVSGESTEGTSPSQWVVNPQLIYRPGPNLIASADEEYRGGDGPNGWFHRFRLDWLPFPDGTLDVEINYTLQANPAPERDTRQGLQTRVQWNLTDRSYIEFLGTHQRSSGGNGNRVQNLQLTYNLTF